MATRRINANSLLTVNVMGWYGLHTMESSDCPAFPLTSSALRHRNHRASVSRAVIYGRTTLWALIVTEKSAHFPQSVTQSHCKTRTFGNIRYILSILKSSSDGQYLSSNGLSRKGRTCLQTSFQLAPQEGRRWTKANWHVHPLSTPLSATRNSGKPFAANGSIREGAPKESERVRALSRTREDRTGRTLSLLTES